MAAWVFRIFEPDPFDLLCRCYDDPTAGIGRRVKGMSSHFRVLTAVLAVALVAGCARQYDVESVESPYGFFSGLWHGAIFLFSLIGCVFFDSVHLIGKPNTGLGYGVGYVLGLMAAFGGGSSATQK